MPPAGFEPAIPIGGRPHTLVLDHSATACSQVEVFATNRSLVQRSLTDCGVSLCVSRNLQNEAALTRVGLLRQRKKK
jgi:hypothetical protein